MDRWFQHILASLSWRVSCFHVFEDPTSINPKDFLKTSGPKRLRKSPLPTWAMKKTRWFLRVYRAYRGWCCPVLWGLQWTTRRIPIEQPFVAHINLSNSPAFHKQKKQCRAEASPFFRPVRDAVGCRVHVHDEPTEFRYPWDQCMVCLPTFGWFL